MVGENAKVESALEAAKTILEADGALLLPLPELPDFALTGQPS
jgi:hypothetical protein